MTRFDGLLETLATSGVQFIVVGGAAGAAHGSARFTQALEVVYARNRANLERIVSALAPYSPYLRGAPPGLPFGWDVQTLQSGLNFTLTTDLGPLDLLGEITGGGKYEDLLPHTEQMEMFGVTCRFVTLVTLIQLNGPPAGRATSRRSRNSKRSSKNAAADRSTDEPTTGTSTRSSSRIPHPACGRRTRSSSRRHPCRPPCRRPQALRAARPSDRGRPS